MPHVALAALCLLSAAALAQTAPDAGIPDAAAAEAPSTRAAPADAEVRQTVQDELEQAKRELRDEVKAQLATQEATSAFEQEWREEKTRLELFTLDGYFRTRPLLFNNLDLDRGLDPSGYPMAPRILGTDDNTQAWADMRLRLEPTLNVSEEVAIKMQIDVLDNLVFGSTPETGFTAAQRYQYDVFNETQIPPRSAVNAFYDSIMVKRAYGEVSTPVGILRFGRMGAHWGLGMQWNDGNCLDCDYGDTVDRFMFVTEIFDGFYVAPMVDFNVEGVLAQRRAGIGPYIDLSNNDDSHSYNIAIARRDTDQQAKARLDNGLSVFNYGVLFSYRAQSFSATGYQSEVPIDPAQGDDFEPPPTGRVLRQANLYMPNIWAKYETKSLRLELEAAGVFGNIGNRALNAALANDVTQNQSLGIMQFGAVLQGEYRFLEEEKVRIGLELGFASGDRAPGFGARPGRPLPASRIDGQTVNGDIDGPQYACESTGGCTDRDINNFVFDRDYYVDILLWRQMIGSVTDALYIRPSLKYQVAPGLELFGSAIYSRAVFSETAPGWNTNLTPGPADLGVELNAGATFETDDGFLASVRYGILFPLGGLKNPLAGITDVGVAQGIRGYLGIRF